MTSCSISEVGATDEDLVLNDEDGGGAHVELEEIDEDVLLGRYPSTVGSITTAVTTTTTTTNNSLNSLIDTVADKILGDLADEGAQNGADDSANSDDEMRRFPQPSRTDEDTTEELDYDDDPDLHMSGFGANSRHDLMGIGVSSYEEDDEEEERQRDKFKSERSFDDPPTVVRISSANVGGVTRVIPDSLDDVRIKLTTRRETRPNRGGYRDSVQGKVLLNPFYRGSVSADSNVRLRFETSSQPVIHLGAVKIRPPRPLRGDNGNFMSLAGPPMVPASGGPPMVPVLSTVPLRPGTMTPYGFVAAAQPMPLGGFSSSSGFMVPPPQLPQNHAFAGFGPPPGAAIPPKRSSISSTNIPPLISRQRVGDSAETGDAATNWDFAVAEFVSRNASKGDRAKAPLSDRRRDRDRDEPRRRERRSRSRTRSRSRSRPRSQERMTDYRRSRSNERTIPDSGSRNERQRDRDVELKAAKMSAKELGLDDEYMEKLEKQKRMRDAIIEKKEQKREEQKKRKRDDDTEREPVKPLRAQREAVAPRSDRQRQRRSPITERLSKQPDSGNKLTKMPRSGGTSDDRNGSGRRRKQSVSPSDIRITSRVRHEEEAIGVGATVETADNRKRKSVEADSTTGRGDRRVLADASGATLEGRRANAETGSSSAVKPPEGATVGKKMIAAVIRNFIDKPGLLDRMRLIAKTVGEIKRCDRPSADAIVIVYTNVNHAAQFVKQYNGKTLNGAKISVTLENYIILK